STDCHEQKQHTTPRIFSLANHDCGNGPFPWWMVARPPQALDSVAVSPGDHCAGPARASRWDGIQRVRIKSDRLVSALAVLSGNADSSVNVCAIPPAGCPAIPVNHSLWEGCPIAPGPSRRLNDSGVACRPDAPPRFRPDPVACRRVSGRRPADPRRPEPDPM